MTEAKKEIKPKAPVKLAAKSEKPVAKTVAKPAAKKESAPAGSVKITQLIGTIARRWDQEATLKGLGLGKRHKSSVLKDTPEVRGMIYKVRHLIKVEKAS
jgi:large subunit ribosomal protein L30